MQKSLSKVNSPKTRTTKADKSKNAQSSKRNRQNSAASLKKNSGALTQILNYQYQDNDVELFVH